MNFTRPDAFKRKGATEQEALERVQASTNAAWFVNTDHWIPARVQLFFIRLWLWLASF